MICENLLRPARESANFIFVLCVNIVESSGSNVLEHEIETMTRRLSFDDVKV